MLKKLAPALLGLTLLAGPLFASALTTDELIQNLLQQIRQLQEQLRQLQGQGGNNVPQSCVVLNYNLYLGLTDQDTNGEVTKLQQFLASDRSIYPEGKVTGYFGPATERAVKRYQSRNGIVSSGSPETTGYGVVGPKTREYMARGCTSTQQLSLSVIGVPMNPLQVNQVGTWTVAAYPNNWALTYSASWGDGQSTVGQTSPTFSHTYTYAGTFTPSFTATGPIPPHGNAPFASVSAPAVIVVAPVNPAPFFTASPMSGPAPLTVTFTTNSASDIKFGDGQTGQITPPTTSHTYTSAGTYIASANGIPVTITVSAAQPTLTFSASPTSGTAPLTVGFTGVATRPNFAADGQSRIDFGDGTSRNITNFADPPAGTSIPALGSFAETHTYTTAGTFTATMTSAGGGTRTVTITVSSVPEYGTLSVAPTSGTAPLSVTATFTVGSPCSAYTLTWGDGTNDSHSTSPPIGCVQIVSTVTKTHTYAAAGAYTVTFQTGGSTTKTATVTVTAPSGGTTSNACTPRSDDLPYGIWASPTSGNAPLSVTFQYPTGTSYAWDTIDFGDGSNSAGYLGTANYKNGCVVHTYASAGTFIAQQVSQGTPIPFTQYHTKETITVTVQ